MYVLGFKAIYHGDYFFGPPKDRGLVTGFPYNLMPSPIYNGKSISYLGSTLWAGRPAGILLCVWTFVVFNAAGLWEDEITKEIYGLKQEGKMDREKAD